MKKHMKTTSKEAALYVVIDDRCGPVAAGSKKNCLSFVAAKLDEQIDSHVSNPASLRVQKVLDCG